VGGEHVRRRFRKLQDHSSVAPPLSRRSGSAALTGQTSGRRPFATRMEGEATSVTHRVTLGSILAHPGAVRDVGSGLYTALPLDAVAAPYDRRAVLYDAVVGRSIYQRIFWGTSVAAHTRFARAALEAAGGGCFAEAGCGSLLFTSSIYREFRGTFALLVDRSARMLRRAMKRLSSDAGRVPEGVEFLQSDIARLPVHARREPVRPCDPARRLTRVRGSLSFGAVLRRQTGR
jgi:hypothetical protein